MRSAAEVWEGDQEVGFGPRLLAQASLPYRNPGTEKRVWGRRNGDLLLTISPGMTINERGEEESIGFPFGTMPRLIMTLLATEAVRTQSPEITFGSLTEFMASMGLAATGGKNGSLTRMREQGHRLFNANITVEYKGDSNRRVGAKLSVASAYNLWCGSEPENGQAALFSSMVRLSPEFFEEVTKHPVPVDLNAIKALGGSALRLDIYTWLTYRMFTVSRPTTVPWDSLMVQFGSTADITDRRRRHQFRNDFMKALKQVLIVYPQANVDVTDAGVRLSPGLPHVAISQGFRALAVESQAS
ncbi:replication protein RepA [Nocardia sp. NPDC049220]|uniref:replication protein RepA n=1 Tax=Nocardia sp. NPDC049220 TaxID=3155273 RepID=UPI0033CFC2D5